VRAAPAVSCAKLCEEPHTSIQVQRKHSGLPRAMVLRLISRSPWRPGFLATIIREKLASHELDASVGASEPHDFAVRDRQRSSHAALASTASHRAFVTCATPLSSGGTGQASSADLPDALSGIFFATALDRFLLICPTGCYVAPVSPHRHCERSDSSAEARRAKAEAIQSAARFDGRGLP
jgi:hypothetical protein